MSSPFAAQTMPLGQLFTNLHMIQTPPYQRSFVWEQEEAGQLLEDLATALDAEDQGGEPGEYFLGTMLFIERQAKRLTALPFSRQSRLLEVVDGLQRLTTLTILFCIIRDFDRADGGRANERLLSVIDAGPARHRLSLREPEETFFQTYVRELGATRISPPDGDLSSAATRILEVRDHLRRAVEEFGAPDRQRLADFLLDKCHVIMGATTGTDRAHQIFTVLNARGKPLARNDMLKADLLGSVPPAAMSRATAAWDQAEARLGNEFESLFSHIRTIQGRTSPQVIAAITQIASEAGGGLAFIERILQPAADIFDSITHARHAGSPHSQAIGASLTYLGWLKGNTDWVPPALLWWMQKGSDAGELAWFLGQLDRLAYGLRILGHGSRRRISRFGAVVHAIRNGRDLRSPSSPLNLTREELRTIHHNLRDLHARSAPIAKLVLLRLNDHISGSPQNLDVKNMTVEHVLPRKPGINSEWRGWFADPRDRDKFTESLGNLVLTTKDQNDRAGNLDFGRKKDVLFQTPGAPVVAINDYVRRQPTWKVGQIIEREAELLRHLDTLWALGTPSRPNPPGNPSSQRQRPVRGEPTA
jgi:Protein of unknown function DUF262/Protein of unknown function (DUF1524)